MKSSFYRSFGVLLLAASLSGKAATGPTPRIDYALCYYPPSKALIMHGGWGPDSQWWPSSEVWQLDASGWRALAWENSPAFAHHSMAYDAARQVLVTCGQDFAMGSTQEIWEFDGARWTNTFALPEADFGDAELAYDPVRQRVVLYRGAMDQRVETWECAASNWEKRTPAHSPRPAFDGALLEYDPMLGQCLLIAGGETDAETETWLWDGNDWTQAVGAQPPAAFTGGMAFDEARQKLVLLTTKLMTWTFDGAVWTELPASQAPSYERLGCITLKYDPTRRKCSFFSGEAPETTYPDQVWDWDGDGWTEFTAGTIEPEVRPLLAVERAAAGTVLISWSDEAADCLLESSPALGASASWTVCGEAQPGVSPKLAMSTTNAARFFRLRKP